VSRPSSEQLIHELARDVPPVRRLPRLRTVVAVVLAGWALAVGLMWGPARPLSEVVAGAAWGDARFVTVLAGLLLVAAGALLAALAGAVPGRERTAATAAGAAGAGLVVAVAGGLWAVSRAASPAPPGELAAAVVCMSHACALALLPVLAASLFLARGWVRRPPLSAGLAVMGTVALGGLVIHVGCRSGGALHVLLGHSLAPLLLGFVLAFPVGWLIRR
jgi:hypothetical protein